MKKYLNYPKILLVVLMTINIGLTQIQPNNQQAVKILLSEIVARPTKGEYIEIYNPNSVAVDLSNYYLANTTFQSGNIYYYQVVEGGGGGGDFADFNARFPDGATIQPWFYQTVALAGDSLFFDTYGIMPTYELWDDGHATPSDAPDMREAVPGSINGQGGLTNGDEDVILYYWDGMSDLVVDIDYLIYESPSGSINEQVDKTNVSIDGPDAGTDSSTYLPDTPIANQVAAPIRSGDGWSSQRIDYTEGNQTPTGGNGVTGADETSENLDVTWTDFGTPTPNGIADGIEHNFVLMTTFSISQNYPNPFNPTTKIQYQLPQASNVSITIYNLVGQKVKTLVNDFTKPGIFEVEWNGLNDVGVKVGSGVYFYKFQAEKFLDIKKMLLLK